MAETKPDAIDAFLRALPEPQRTALEELRATIRAVVPEAEEIINYGVPMFRLGGKNLVSFGAAKTHGAFYVQSPAVMEALADDLKGYDTSKGTVRFTPDQPIPAALVKKLVKARVTENEASAKGNV